MTITEFLLARIDEDEEAARAVPPLDHNYDMGGRRQDEQFVFTRYLPDSMDGRGNWAKDDPATAVHFARHDPARVLAESKAKRRIIDLHPVRWQEVAMPRKMGEDEIRTERVAGPFYDDELLVLAEVYASHPDFDPAWRMA